MKLLLYTDEHDCIIIRISHTQTMENTTEVEYISIYDKPKRGRGRPKTCNLSDEEKRQRKIETAKQYYKNNYEYVRLQKRIWLDKKYEQQKENIN